MKIISLPKNFFHKNYSHILTTKWQHLKIGLQLFNKKEKLSSPNIL